MQKETLDELEDLIYAEAKAIQELIRDDYKSGAVISCRINALAKLTMALRGISAQGETIVPVYINGKKLEDIVVKKE